jgi:hypothetical protein
VSANEWLGLVSFFILVWFGLRAYDRVRKANAHITAVLAEFEAAHPRPEGEK